MNYYINVKFGVSNKTYYFGTDDESLQIGDLVVVETIVGLEMAEVTTFPKPMDSLKFDREIKPILRKATDDDKKTCEFNEELAAKASKTFMNHVQELKLDMRLLGSQYTLDRAKILFTYVADDRVDFRELLKLLASDLHCRIELKQINSRERAQLVGGLGVCGLPLCCTTFFTSFDGVSLNKAKNQMLSINIPKLSGQCGKLMCCLKYEDDYYTEAKKLFPPLNTKIKYQDAEYKITSFNIFNKIVKLQNSTDVVFLSLDEVNSILNINRVSNTSLDENKQVVKPLENKINSKEQVNKQVFKTTKDNLAKESNTDTNINQDRFDGQKNSNQRNLKNKQKIVNENSASSKTNSNIKQDKNAKQKSQKKNDNVSKKSAKYNNNAVNDSNYESKFLFAGQANKVKEYQENYAKNNKSKEQNSSKTREQNKRFKRNKQNHQNRESK